MLRAIVMFMINFGLVELFSILFVAVNIFTFLLYLADKRKAMRNKWRISENMLILFTLVCGGIGAFLGMKLARHKTRKPKFKIAVILGLIIAFIPIIHIAHSLTFDRVIRFVEIPFYSANWPSALNGYRIAFMADFHTITEEEMQRVAAELKQRDLDLLLLGGDFSMRNNHYQGTLRQIAQISTTDGIFGVEGNHDDYRRVFAMKEQIEIVPLDNSGTHIRDSFFIGGVQDLWNRNPNVANTIASANPDDFILLISHNPDVTMLQATEGIDLILSGHTHGGQITFFGLPFYLLRRSITDYGMHFSQGFAYSADGVPVFVTSGVGVYYNLPRVFSRPEVVIFTMAAS